MPARIHPGKQPNAPTPGRDAQDATASSMDSHSPHSTVPPRYRTLLESTRAIPWKHDLAEDRYTHIDPQIEAMLGHPAEAWLQPGFGQAHIHPDDREWAPRFCFEAARRGEDHEFEYRMLAADGHTVWLRHHVSVIGGTESPRGLQGFLFDISEQKQAQAVLSEDYAAVLDPTAQQYLARTRAAAQRMGQLIDDLLGLAQITHQGLHPADTDLGALARDSLARLAMADPQRCVDIRIGEALHAHADRQLMAIVPDNLLGNAWKYTSNRENARIEFDKHEREDQTVFFVRDSGTGFDMRYASKLFMPFQRLHGSDHPGTGIGLATVQRIIHRHGGRIGARAMPDQGATFHFTLPLTPAAAELPACPR